MHIKTILLSVLISLTQVTWAASDAARSQDTAAHLEASEFFARFKLQRASEVPVANPGRKKVAYTTGDALKNQVVLFATVTKDKEQVVDLVAQVQEGFLAAPDTAGVARDFAKSYLLLALAASRSPQLEQFLQELGAGGKGSDKSSEAYLAYLGQRPAAALKVGEKSVMLKHYPADGPRPASLLIGVVTLPQ